MTLILTIIDLLGFTLSLWVKDLIQLGTGLLLAPKFGYKLHQLSLFGQYFIKQDGVWEHTRGKFSPLIQTHITVDLNKPQEPDALMKNEKRMEALRCTILLLFAAAAALLLLPYIRQVLSFTAEQSIGGAFLGAFAIGMIVHSLVTVGIRFYVYGVLMKKLMGYVQTLTNRLRAGERFSEMGLRPVEELPYKNPSPMEKMFYYSYYLSAMLEQGNIGALQQPTREMTAYFRNREYIIAETWNYYWLVFYYSRFELNPAAANHFLERVRDTLQKDRDANAKRVLAYYAFGIEQDFPKARALLNEAYAVVDKFSSAGERELERRLLNDLDGYLRAKGF